MRKNKGFTLIEIIAVVIIIGIIALIAVPSVSSYIANSRNTTYKAHEKTMEEAAQSLTIEVINGKDSLSLPRRGDHAEVFLNELVDKEYLESLKDPATGELCNESMSYVIIKNVGSSNYEYKSCLYCGTYITESDECSAPSVDDNEKPVCGMITGESSEWTNKSRTITVSCSDAGSGCTRNKFTKVFNTTTDKGFVQISDKSGKTEDCQVNVRVDKTEPTCELIAEGDDNIESTGWSSGRTVVVKYKANSRKDEHSGIITYGIGTSLKNRNYNKNESYAVENVSGTTTVIGYVKDNAGNEGVCYKTVTTGLERPKFDVRYGYQIYPLKERFELSGATQSGDNKITTTTTTPSITFKNMSKYQGVTAVIMELASGVSDPSSFKLTVNGNTYSGSSDNASNSRIRFYIETEPTLNSVSSQNDYKITLGNKSGVAYTIIRIELELKSGNISSKHNVAVNLITRKAVVKTTKWSWDNASHWENQYYKLFDPTTGAKSGNAKVKNDIPLTSDPVAYSIGGGDGTAPSITITSGNTNWTNQDIVLTGKVNDTGTGIIGYMWSTSNNVHYYDAGWQYYDTPTNDEKTYTHTITKNGTYYLYAKDEAGNVGKKSITVTNIDKNVPTCSAIADQAKLTCTDPTADNDYGQSKINRYYWGTKENPTVSDFKSVTETDSFSKTESVSLGNGTRYYLYVMDKAGNKSAVKSDLYYTVTYDKNGDGTITKPSDIRRKNTNADLSDLFKATKNGYTFKGWNTSTDATTKLDSYKVTGDVTLYAVWAITNPTSVTLSGAATKIYGASDTTITCDQDKTYASGTTLYYSFGYSTTEAGTPENWTTAGTTNSLKIGKTDYYGDRYYYCKIYAKNSYLTSGEVTSNKQLVRYNNAKITFDGNTGTVNGTNPVYVRTGSASSYTEIRNNTTATNPTASKSCYTFNGWYTAKSSGSKVLKNDGKLTGSAVSGYTSASAWTAIENKSLYAQWTAHTYTVSYDVDKGTHGSSHPTSATYDTAFTVDNPSKSVTISFDLGSSGGTASSTSSITKSYTFAGWKITGMDSVTHTYGSNTTTNTSISSTSATSYKNLLCNSGTVSFLALWTPPSITLPTITRRGYTCKWVSGSYNWTSDGTYTPSTSGGATSRTMTASCSQNTYSCSAGSYLDVDTTCKTCPAGNYCPGGTWTYNDKNQGINPCPSGYTSATGKSSEGQCYRECSAGNYLKAKASSCSTCTAGSYCAGGTYYYKNSDQGITGCPGNMTSAEGKSAIGSCYISCSAGKYLAANGSSCSTCTGGSYCGGGTYYYKNSAQGITKCPGSMTSAEGKSAIGSCYIACSSGNYLTANGSSCSTCTGGSYCAGGTYYYKNSAQGITGCPGSMTSAEGKSAIGSCYIACSAGKYLATNGSSCSTCTTGSYCGGGTYYYKNSDQGITKCPSSFPSSSTGSTKIQNCYSAASRYQKKTTRTCTKYESWTVTTKTCGSSTSYDWSKKYTDKDRTCKNNKFECDASTSGQTYVSCSSNSCISGSNTCKPGNVYGAWGDYESCTLGPDQVFPSDTVDCTTCKPGLYKCRFRTKTWSSCATGSNNCVSGYDISKWDCKANTTYAFGTASAATGQSTCSTNTITCDSDHVNQNDVACTETSTYSFVDTLDSTSTSCSTGTYFDCVSGKQGTSYVSNCEDGDYYCSSGTLSGTSCYSP